ncbi:hypothetical protein KKB40_06295 [Patescibacteria group bacterium]|nr:hypothetical protein [Patescibacteria group bacterium]
MSKTREEYSEDLESQYRRLERKYLEVTQNFNRDTFSKSSQEILDSVHDFFVVCYHLREWIKKDKKVTKNTKDALPSFEDGGIKPNDPKVSLLICRDMCNSFKHRELEEKRKPNDINTKINSMGGAIFKVPLQELHVANKEKKTVHLKEEDAIYMGNFIVTFMGNRYELQGVVESCMHFWNKFFEENDLLMPRSTPYSK